MSGLRERLAAVRHDADRGTTLLELIVAMGLMSIFMAIFTGSMILVSSTAAKVEAISTTSAQSSAAFLRLDRSVRYANAISTPAFSTSAGVWHVEWDSSSTSRTASAASTTETCNQLRIDPVADKLQLRTWAVTSSGYSGLTSWLTVTSAVSNGSTASDSPAPFVLPAQTGAASTGLQQLQINLTTSSTTTTSGTTSSSYTFTALNSYGAPSASTVCQQVAIGATS